MEAPAGVRLVERPAELAALDRVLADARQRHGRLALIVGEPGLGKTALVEATRAKAARLGFTVLTAIGGELERELPFGVVHQLLRGSIHRAAERTLDAASDFRLYWLVSDLTEHAPVVALIDDAHWIDEPSLRFLAFVARRLDGLRLALVLAARPSEPGAAGPSLRRRLAGLGAGLIEPRPLTAAGTRRVVLEALGDDIPAGVPSACHRVTLGNPYFLHQLLREVEVDSSDRGRALEPSEIAALAPGAIAELVGARMGRLPDHAKALADAAAVLGEPAPLPRARALAGLEPDDAELAADALAGASILARGRPLRFAHPIVRSVVYADRAAGERSADHVRAARLLASEGASHDDVAVQLLAAEPRGDPWILARLREAARAAANGGAPESAARYLRRALLELPSASERVEMLVEAGAAEARAGDPRALEDLSAALDRAADPGLRVRATVELGQVLAYAGRTDDAGRVVRETLDALPSDDPALRRPLEMMLLVLAQTAVAPRRRALDLLPGAAAVVERLGADAPRGLAAIIALERALVDGTAADAAALGELALADGRLISEQTPEAPHAHIACAALAAADRIELAENHLEAAIADARRRGSARAYAFASAIRAWFRARFGRLAGGEADARACLELATETGWHMFAPPAVGALARILLERHEFAEAEPVLEQLEADAEHRDLIFVQPLLQARAELALARGEPERALRDLSAIARWEAEWGARDGAWVSWRPSAALAHAALGETTRAREVASEAVDSARRFGAASLIGTALHAHALVSGRSERLEMLSTAREVLEDAPAPLELAGALVDFGAETRHQRKRVAARVPLRRGLEIAHRLGASRLERRAREELRLAGAKPRRPVLSGRESLTPGELRVAEMTARGLTNREVGQALFVTVKTVETHLNHIYRKLDISSREELAEALREDPGSKPAA